MFADLNPPLRVGQTLEPRPGTQLPACRLIKFVASKDGLIWTMQPIEGGEALTMTISDIYARFVFPN